MIMPTRWLQALVISSLLLLAPNAQIPRQIASANEIVGTASVYGVEFDVFPSGVDGAFGAISLPGAPSSTTYLNPFTLLDQREPETSWSVIAEISPFTDDDRALDASVSLDVRLCSGENTGLSTGLVTLNVGAPKAIISATPRSEGLGELGFCGDSAHPDTPIPVTVTIDPSTATTGSYDAMLSFSIVTGTV
jgi:hypothetical protein